MKSLFLLFLLSLVLFSCDSENSEERKKLAKKANKEDIPVAVLTSFQKKYPDEKSPDWGVDKNGWYEAHFKKDDEKYRADFRPTGEWIETENDIKEKNLPDPIKKIIKEQFQDYKVVEVERVTHYQKGLFYDVEFKKDGKKMDVEFNEQGEAIGMEEL